MKVRIIKAYKDYTPGQRVEVTRNEAFGLIDAGYAEVDKQMTSKDIKTKKVR